MPSDYEDLDLPFPDPFWFASEELLIEVWHAEVKAMMQLFAKCPNLHELYDTPDTTIPQRAACFELLAHRKIIETINETFQSAYRQSPTPGEEESDALGHSENLVRSDAPAWVLEMNQVAEWLPARISSSLPEPLRDRVSYIIDPAKAEIVGVAKKTFSTVEQIQVLTTRVIDQQLQRLTRRWSVPVAVGEAHPRKKKKVHRTQDKLRARRDQLIAEIDDISTTSTEFIRIMDERNVKPQPTWSGWPGSWKEAYKNPRLRRLIQQDKSRALLRARRSK